MNRTNWKVNKCYIYYILASELSSPLFQSLWLLDLLNKDWSFIKHTNSWKHILWALISLACNKKNGHSSRATLYYLVLILTLVEATIKKADVRIVFTGLKSSVCFQGRTLKGEANNPTVFNIPAIRGVKKLGGGLSFHWSEPDRSLVFPSGIVDCWWFLLEVGLAGDQQIDKCEFDQGRSAAWGASRRTSSASDKETKEETTSHNFRKKMNGFPSRETKS